MKEPAVDANDEAPVAALLLPLQGLNLVVPQAAVGEVIARPEVERVPGAPEWVSGVFEWRAEQLPLVCVERMLGRDRPEADSAGARVVVLYGLGDCAGLDYYGIEVSGIPHPVLLRRQMIDELGEDLGEGGGLIGRAVVVGGQPGLVPDLEALERMLSDWLVRA